MKIHEAHDERGDLVETHLHVEDGAMALEEGGAIRALPPRALEAVMRRYGAPLDPRERVHEVARIELGEGRALRHVRHLARWDVIARDWLVWEAPGEEPLCAMATQIAGALAHLARAASGG